MSEEKEGPKTAGWRKGASRSAGGNRRPPRGAENFDVPGLIGQLHRADKEVHAFVVRWQYVMCGGGDHRTAFSHSRSEPEPCDEDKLYGDHVIATMGSVIVAVKSMLAELDKAGLR